MNLRIVKEPDLLKSHNICDKPLVSISIATYNQERFIKQCVHSILQQETSFDFEILIGEDDSSDGTRALCEDLAQAYPETISLILHHRENLITINGRPTGRFNFLYNLSQCRGKYIALCEGDDYWTDPYKLQKQVDLLEKRKDCALVFSNGRVEYDKSDLKSHPVYREKTNHASEYRAFPIPAAFTTIEDLAKGNYIHTPGVLFRNWVKEEGIPSYLTRTSIGDWPLHMYTATKGDIAFINDELFVYRVHGGGLYSKKSAKEKQEMALGQFEPMIGALPLEGEALTFFLSYIKNQVLNYLYDRHDESAMDFLNPLLKALDSHHPGFVEKLMAEHEAQLAKRPPTSSPSPSLYQSALRRLFGKHWS